MPSEMEIIFSIDDDNKSIISIAKTRKMKFNLVATKHCKIS